MFKHLPIGRVSSEKGVSWHMEVLRQARQKDSSFNVPRIGSVVSSRHALNSRAGDGSSADWYPATDAEKLSDRAWRCRDAHHWQVPLRSAQCCQHVLGPLPPCGVARPREAPSCCLPVLAGNRLIAARCCKEAVCRSCRCVISNQRCSCEWRPSARSSNASAASCWSPFDRTFP